MKKGNVLKSITKQITCIFSGVLNAYWRSLLCAVFCYTVFHFFDLFFIKSVIENDVYTLVYRIGFFVSFCIFSVARGVICENKETEKTAMALGGYKEYLSSYWLVETVLLVLVSFACILLYFIFDELSPFSLAYFYLSETAGFVLSFFALAVCRLLAVVVHFKKRE